MATENKFFLKTLIWASVFSVVLLVLTGWFMPKILVWYAEPIINPGISCTPAIEWSIRVFQRSQAVALAVGVVLGAILTWALKPNK